MSVWVSLDYADWITALCAFGGRVEDSTEVFICDIFLIVFRFQLLVLVELVSQVVVLGGSLWWRLYVVNLVNF